MKNHKNQIDDASFKYYSQGKEKNRLIESPIEFDRTLRILTKKITKTPSIILDVGGAHGVYSFPLAEKGHKVHLIDPIPVHIEQAKEHAKQFPNVKLESYSIGDARNIEFENASVDVVLFFGPLYHLVNSEDRQQALKEARRVLKEDGLFFATAISRYQSFIDYMNQGILHSEIERVKNTLATGIHTSKKTNISLYFHKPEEFKEELMDSGFCDISLLGIEGPIWKKEAIQEVYNESKHLSEFFELLEMIETDLSVVGTSAHVMAVATKKEHKS